MPDEPRQGDVINTAVHLEGDNTGQIAGGKNIVQTTQVVGPPLTQPEREQVRLDFARLREQIAAQAPAERRDQAVGHIEELERAAFEAEPDLTTIQLVTRWFKHNLPALAGSVTSLIATPLVGRLVQVAGDQLVELVGGET
jgi:hypothetical protein